MAAKKGDGLLMVYCEVPAKHEEEFNAWYNEEHRHSGIELLTPVMVHYGEAPAVVERRQAVLDAAYQSHPERFVRQPPRSTAVPKEVWINKPSENKSQ